MLSTKAKDNIDINDAPPEVLMEESRLKMLTQELEMLQRRYMFARGEKDFLELRSQTQKNMGNLKGDVDDSRQGLNMFTMDSERDVRQMRTEVQATQDKLNEITKRIKQQESKQRELAQAKSTAERRLQTVVGSIEDLEARNPGNLIGNLVKKEQEMRKKIPEQAKAADDLMRKVASKPRDEQQIDQSVKTALQTARRNITMLQKRAPGIYQVKNRTRLVMMSMDPQTLELSASYMTENNQSVTEPIATFISKLQ